MTLCFDEVCCFSQKTTFKVTCVSHSFLLHALHIFIIDDRVAQIQGSIWKRSVSKKKACQNFDHSFSPCSLPLYYGYSKQMNDKCPLKNIYNQINFSETLHLFKNLSHINIVSKDVLQINTSLSIFIVNCYFSFIQCYKIPSICQM